MTPGQMIAQYRIISLLGVGGMGEVFLAEDEKLHRRVAIKILPPDMARQPDRLSRFVQEARAASALNHPNVAQIYELGEDISPFIVMEYVDGEPLTSRIHGRPMDLNDILDLGIQAADALVEAHTLGIVHRDIKPGNLVLSSRGQLKVLDFGLAKLKSSNDSTLETEHAETETALTAPGVVMGTVQYMSPEQALGRPVDHRSDIFSFGAVLYEMATGAPPFRGDTPMATIDAILHQPPAWPESPAEAVHPELRRILGKTLEKDRELRYQSMSDLRADLKRLQRDVHAPIALEGVAKAQWVTWILGVIALTLLAGAAIWLWNPSTPDLPAPRISQLTSYPGSETYPALSPDGDLVAFVWNGEQQDQFDIYVKQADSTAAPLRLTSSPANETYPVWAPDGRYLAFYRSDARGSGYYAVPALGGPERLLVGVASFGRAIRPVSASFSPDGRFLAVSDQVSASSDVRAIFQAALDSSKKRQLTFPPTKGVGDWSPSFSPNGRSLAFVRSEAGQDSDLFVVSLAQDGSAAGEPKRIARVNRIISSPAWTPDSRELIFAMALGRPQLRLVRISADGGRIEPIGQVLESAQYPSVARKANRLVYVHSEYDMNLLRVTVGSKEEPLPFALSTQSEHSTKFSPDGKMVAFSSDRTGTSEIWLADSNGDNLRQLTSFDRGTTGSPSWSPDGQFIAYDGRPEGNPEIYVSKVTGGTPRRLTSDPSEDVVPSWSHNGRWIYFGSTRSGSMQVWKMPAEGGVATRVTKDGGFVPVESADGRWIYFLKGRDSPGLWRMPTEGGEETPVLDTVTDRNWQLVSDGIYVIRRLQTGSKQRSLIQFYRFASRQYETLAEMMKMPSPNFPCLAVSPDRHTILYAQIEHQVMDLMLVENFR